VNARRFGRFVTPTHVRRLAPSRIGLAAFAAVSVLTLAVILGMRFLQSSTDWLHRQPLYQLNAESIEFDPPLPHWYRGGKNTFLERARIGLGPGENRSALDIDLQKLGKELSLNCWSKGDVRVQTKYPNLLSIHLNFRIPIAVAKLNDGTEIVIDEEGVLLPRAEIDFAKINSEPAGPLIQLVDFGEGPRDLQPGLYWKRAGGENDLAETDGRIVAAAKLAAFIKEAQAQGGELTGKQQFVFVSPKKQGTHELAMGNEHGLWVAWDEPPGHESAGQPDAKTKWQLVVSWIKQHGPKNIRPLSYLHFSKTGVGYR